MNHYKNKCVTRVENFLQNLNISLFLVNKDVSSLELDEDGFVKIDNEEDVMDYISSLLVKYVVSVCEDEDLSDNQVVGDIEESIEAQKLVEFECNEVYTSRVSLALKNLISSRMSLFSFGIFMGNNLFVNFEEKSDDTSDYEDSEGDNDDKDEGVLYSQTEVSKNLKIRSCRLALEFISDVPLKPKYNKANNNNDSESHEQLKELYVGINYRTHGIMVLKRFVVLCTSVCPFKTELHTQFLKNHLSHTGPTKRINLGYLNCSRPWIAYWTIHSLTLLGEDISPYKERSINTLMSCWDSVYGGFGGGEGQRGHLATTYSALCVLKMFNSLEVVDSKKLYSFLMDMKMNNGSFSSTYGGEFDSRSTYCAVASAHIMGLLTEKLKEKTSEFLQSCQTYEGGLSAEPHLEAHAGYTYCGLSAMAILDELERIDLNKLYHWSLRRLTSQLGFQGRPHKLVDSCYSFWIGGCLEILNNYSDQFFPYNNNGKNNESSFETDSNSQSNSNSFSYSCSNSNSYSNPNSDQLISNNPLDLSDGGNVDEPLSNNFNSNTNVSNFKENEKDTINSQNKPFLSQNQIKCLQDTNKQRGTKLYEQLLRCYLLVVSQTGKGFRDKPNKPSDLYHTCYSLSYLNIVSPITNRKHNILLNLLEF